MSAHTPEKLAYMANQIATNLALADDPVTATAEHIRAFWSPAMRAGLTGEAANSLVPVAREALARLAG